MVVSKTAAILYIAFRPSVSTMLVVVVKVAPTFKSRSEHIVTSPQTHLAHHSSLQQAGHHDTLADRRDCALGFQATDWRPLS